MRIFWRQKDQVTWQLCIKPAALLLTIVRSEKGWTLKCLGQEYPYADTNCPTEQAQKYAVEWLSNEMFAMMKELDRGISCKSDS